jgi:exosome complex component RRP4
MARRMVIPGEFIAEGGYKLGSGVYREDDKIYASVMGLLDIKGKSIRIIPLTGRYIPKVGDYVIGIINDIEFACWYVDINSSYSAVLNANDYFREIDPFQTDLSKILTVGDTIFARVREITPRKKVYITMKERGLRVIKKGKIVEMTPTKVPRIIGKKGSMLNILKKETRCRILVGQNGRIWLDGASEMVEIATKAIEKIEREAHTSGLTDRVRNMIIRERERR